MIYNIQNKDILITVKNIQDFDIKHFFFFFFYKKKKKNIFIFLLY